jgi:dTDP-4-dehydrorhamnose reductase
MPQNFTTLIVHLTMLKVLLTGVNGFTGYYLCRQLLNRSFTVYATGKGNNRLPFVHNNFHYNSLDFTDVATIASACDKIKPDVIIHTGALSNADECEQNKEAAFRTNVTGTINILEAAKKIKSHFVFLSTDFVFDGERGLYKEDDNRAPVNYYGETKLLAENEVMKYEYDWSIVRTVLVYGKNFSGKENFVTSIAQALKDGKPLKIFDDQVRTPTYVEDLVKGVVFIVEKKAGGIYHISGEEVLTPYQMAVEVAKYLHLNENEICPVQTNDIKQMALRPLKTGLNISKAKKELGYQPVSFAEGLQKTFTED